MDGRGRASGDPEEDRQAQKKSGEGALHGASVAAGRLSGS